MNILTITTLYPNTEQERHGVFVENRLRKLREKFPDVHITVIAPVPYFPLTWDKFGAYGKYAKIPYMEKRHGVTIYHPRYLVIPKVGMSITPYFLYRCLYKLITKLQKQNEKFDLIDAHYFYPDGVAANRLAKKVSLPIAITARGNDISLIPNYKTPRKLIKETLLEADACIGVCKALVDEMKQIQPEQVNYYAFRNGVDLEVFTPLELSKRHELRAKYNVTEKFVLISVGHFIERKGHHLIIDALINLPNTHLFLAGDGELDNLLRQQVNNLSLQNQVTFLGAIPQTELLNFYGISDCMVLASSREGWANVLLESMACGTPVVATPIWGTPEVVSEKSAGILTKGRSADAIEQAILALQQNYPDRKDVRKFSEKFSWDETSTKLYELFISLIGNK